jgi:hypothetical protein
MSAAIIASDTTNFKLQACIKIAGYFQLSQMPLLKQVAGPQGDPFWLLNAGDYFSLAGLLISLAALGFAAVIYFRLRKQERAHKVNALSLTHVLLAVAHDLLEGRVRDYSDNQQDQEKLLAIRRITRDFHPILSKYADRIERALDPVRIHLSTDLNNKLTDMTDYFRTMADQTLEDNKPTLQIPDAVDTWFHRQRELVKELDEIMTQIRKEAPEIKRIL